MPLSPEAAAAREAGNASRFRFLCYLHFLNQLAPRLHLGADGRRYIRGLVRKDATYPPFYVYDQVSHVPVSDALQRRLRASAVLLVVVFLMESNIWGFPAKFSVIMGRTI